MKVSLNVTQVEYLYDDKVKISFTPNTLMLDSGIDKLTKEELEIVTVSKGNKEDFAIEDFVMTKKKGWFTIRKPADIKDDIELNVKLGENDEVDINIPKKEEPKAQSEATPQVPPVSSERGTESGKESQPPSGTEQGTPKSPETEEEGQPAAELLASRYSPQPRFTYPSYQKVFNPQRMEIYFKDDMSEEDYNALTRIEEWDNTYYQIWDNYNKKIPIMKEGGKNTVCFTDLNSGPAYILIDNFTRREFEEYMHVQRGTHARWYFTVKKHHPRAVDKIFNIHIKIVQIDKKLIRCEGDVNFFPVNDALPKPVITNNKKESKEVMEIVHTKDNEFSNFLMVWMKRDENWDEVLHVRTEPYHPENPFKDPYIIRKFPCDPIQAPNRSKTMLAFYRVHGKWCGDFKIIWTVKGKNNNVCEVEQKFRVTGYQPEMAGYDPIEWEEMQMYGGSTEEREKWLSYNSLRRELELEIDDYSKMLKQPGFTDYEPYVTDWGYHTNFYMIKQYFDKYKFGIFKIANYGITIRRENFLDVLKNWYPYRFRHKDNTVMPPYWRTETSWYSKRKEDDGKEIDLVKLAKDIGYDYYKD